MALADRVCGALKQDKKQQTVVNNDSGEIMEMLNSEFDSLRQDESCPDLYPTELQSQIDDLNNFISGTVNIGVYKCAFSKSQASNVHTTLTCLQFLSLQT